MSQLTWKTEQPRIVGWYWVRTAEGREQCVEFVKQAGRVIPNWTGNYVAFAGPIARPVHPSARQLATVRYKISGDYLNGYYFETEWFLADLREVERRCRRHLCGDATYYTRPVEADCKRVYIRTSHKRNGRWSREPRVEFKMPAAAPAPALAEVAS